MIKIAFVIDTIASPTAGTEKQLIQIISNLDRSKFKAYLCVLQSSEWLHDNFTACEVINLGFKSFKSLKSLYGILRFTLFLRKNRIDIVQTHFRDSTIFGALSSKLAKIKCLIVARRNQGYWMESIDVTLQKLMNPLTHIFIANSKSTKEWLIHKEGISDSKIKVIYNCIDTKAFDSIGNIDRYNARREIKVSDTEHLIGIVANLRPVKGIDIYLRAAALVLVQLPKTHFCIVGEGPERADLENLSKNLGIDAHVSFLGKREDIPKILAGFDVGVLSSHSESFSNAVVEYLASGLPVVCTDVGGSREVLGGSESGVIVPVNDPNELACGIINTILNTRVERKLRPSELIHENYSIENIMFKYEEIYLNCYRAN